MLVEKVVRYIHLNWILLS